MTNSQQLGNSFDGLCVKNNNHSAIQETLFFQQQRDTKQQLIEELENPEPPTEESTGLNKNGFRRL